MPFEPGDETTNRGFHSASTRFSLSPFLAGRAPFGRLRTILSIPSWLSSNLFHALILVLTTPPHTGPPSRFVSPTFQTRSSSDAASKSRTSKATRHSSPQVNTDGRVQVRLGGATYDACAWRLHTHPCYITSPYPVRHSSPSTCDAIAPPQRMLETMLPSSCWWYSAPTFIPWL